MTIGEQFSYNLWAISSDKEEVAPYLDNPFYNVLPNYKYNGEQDGYFIHLK